MIAKIGIGVVAVIHCYFAYKEIADWGNLSGDLLGFTGDLIEKTEVLGINQGAYNAFFAIGLLAVLTPLVPAVQKKALAVFCLASLTAAGLVGLLTIQNVVFLAQLLPAALALVFVLREQ